MIIYASDALQTDWYMFNAIKIHDN